MYQITSKRNRFIIDTAIKCAKQVRLSGSKPTVDKIIAGVRSANAPCYFAEYDRALRIMNLAIRNGSAPTSSYACGEMWGDMYRDLCILIKRRPKATVGNLIADLLSGNAGKPRIYASDRCIRTIINPYLIQIVDL
jgi:hypothetical protein